MSSWFEILSGTADTAGRVSDRASRRWPPTRSTGRPPSWSGDRLTPVGSAEQARELWRHIFRTFVDSDRQPGADAGYAVEVRHSRHRVESWLATLETQGSLPEGDNSTRARYLLTVIDGLAINRALPDDGLTPEVESAILRAAVDAALQLPWPSPTGA